MGVAPNFNSMKLGPEQPHGGEQISRRKDFQKSKLWLGLVQSLWSYSLSGEESVGLLPRDINRENHGRSEHGHAWLWVSAPRCTAHELGGVSL